MRLRILLCSVALAVGAVAQAQVWEKFIAPGITYRMEVDLAAPRIIHAIRYSMSATSTKAIPELGQRVVFTESVANSRETVSDMVAKGGAIGGINADFFPWTGDPLGVMVRDGELISKPFNSRGAFAWGQEGASVSSFGFKAELTAKNGRGFALDGINEEASGNMIVANAAVSGYARSKGECVMAVVKMDDPKLRVGAAVTGEVVAFYTDASNMPVRNGNVILVATGTRRASLRELSVGDQVSMRFDLDGFDAKRMTHAVGGGPFLVKNGKIDIDAQAQGFGVDFSEKRHPRTAVGRTDSGDVWWIAIDGRQSMSIGATLEETAHIALKLGCVDAVNLDGGGSTAINLMGVTLNRPSDGTERPVANGVLFFGPKPDAMKDAPIFSGPTEMVVGTSAQLQLKDAAGAVIPHSEILWGAYGAAWIDQGGSLRAVVPGVATVRAYVRGRSIVATIAVTPASGGKRQGLR